MMTEDAFHDLYDALYPLILRFVRGAVSNQADVEDVVQDVFVRVARHYDGYRAQASLQTWVLAIAKHVIVDYWRKRQRDAARPTQSLETMLPADERFVAARGDDVYVRDPAEHIATHDELTRIRCCIDTLPANMRLVLLCRLYQDLTNTETAQVLGWTAARVRVTYSRAIRRFTAAWKLAEGQAPAVTWRPPDSQTTARW